MDIPYFDAHCDTLTPVTFEGGRLRKNDLHLDLRRLGAYLPCAQVFAICTTQAADLRSGYRADMETLRRELAENADILTLCLSAGDARRAGLEGKIAGFLSVEGAEHIGCGEDELDAAYADGVRIVNITWNFNNELAGAAMASDNYGLTEAGRSYIRHMQRLGVLADMSHISEAAFWDAVDITARPLIASHSNSRVLCDHPRNLTDEQFTALIRTGGGAGLNLCPDFLGLGRDVDAVVEHAEHFLSLGGQRALFLGGDLDGILDMPRGISGVQDMGRLWEAMLHRNWSEELVRNIFYGNLMDIMERSL